MSERVLLHVGTPKTGTSYVQDVLWRNRPTLAEHGILYPAERFDGQFLAALDLLGLPWGGLEVQARGTWAELAAATRAWSGTTIVSHEILASATRAQAERALADVGPAEVHLVVSARDLARQIPAEWQENVKHRRTFDYAAFLAEISDPQRGTPVASWFWAVQELPDILDRWGADLPPERVHVVTVPAPGAPRDLLWSRFAGVLGLAGLELDLTPDRENPSLGVPETALLRRVNEAVNAVVAPADYRPLVRELLAHRTLSQRTGSPRLGVPPATRAWAEGLERAWIADLEQRGYDVVGDLGDLQSEPTGEQYVDPDRPPEDQVAAAGVDAVKALLEEVVAGRERTDDLDRRLAEAEAALAEARRTPTRRAKEKVVRTLESGAPGRAVMSGYRRARGAARAWGRGPGQEGLGRARNSRSA